MNKSVKKMLLFVAVVIIVIVMISAVYLLLLTPGGDNSGTPPPSAPASSSVSPSPSELTPSPSAAPSPADNVSCTSETTAAGIVYHVIAQESLLSYSVTIDEKAFTFGDKDGQIQFLSKTNESEFLEISFIKDAEGTELAPSFLDKYLDYKEFEQSGLDYIGATEIKGEKVTANDGTKQVEAWLVDTEKGVLAVVISYSLGDQEAQRKELSKMLDSLTIG